MHLIAQGNAKNDEYRVYQYAGEEPVKCGKCDRVLGRFLTYWPAEFVIKQERQGLLTRVGQDDPMPGPESEHMRPVGPTDIPDRICERCAIKYYTKGAV